MIIATAFTGCFRAFERIAMTFCAGSLLLIPLYLMAHPSGARWCTASPSPGCPAARAAAAWRP